MMSRLNKKPDKRAYAALSDGHLKVLRRCRMVLIKDIDPVEVVQHLAAVDNGSGLRSEACNAVLEMPTREEQAGLLLDLLERRGDATFVAFLDVLKDRYRHVHSVIEETARTLDENDDEQLRERAAIVGDNVRRLLRNSIRHRATASEQQRRRRRHSDVASSDNFEESDDDGKGHYIDCYTVPTRGRLQTEKWIRHAGPPSSTVVMTTGTSYMVVLRKDLLFRRVDRSELPPAHIVKHPLPLCRQVFVLDLEGTTNLSANHGSTNKSQKQAGVHAAACLIKSKKNNVCRKGKPGKVSDAILAMEEPAPPPLPPKPDNLPQLSTANQPPVPPRKGSRSADEMHERQVPSDSPAVESSSANELTSLSEASSPPVPVRLPRAGSPKRNVRKDPIDVPRKSEPVLESGEILADNIKDNLAKAGATADLETELNFNISPEEEDPYEAIGSGGERTQNSSLQTCAMASDSGINIAENGGHGIRLQSSDSDVSDDEGTVTYASHAAPPVPSHRNPRDSGVDSVLGFAESPFGVSPVSPISLSDMAIPFDDRASDYSHSHYETIEMLSECATYLDPRSTVASRGMSKVDQHHPNGRYSHYDRQHSNRTIAELESQGRKFVAKGSLFVVDTNVAYCAVTSGQLNLAACHDLRDVKGSSPENVANWHKNANENDRFVGFDGTHLAFDREGHAYYVPSDAFKRHGDPSEELWFYPVAITEREATLFLGDTNQKGCFVVYRPANGDQRTEYILSVCRGNGDVVHYQITSNAHGDVSVRGHDHSFMNVCELVTYFRRNQSQLATRLRRSLRESLLPMTPGYHYPARYELHRGDISITDGGDIVAACGEGSGSTRLGNYRGAAVMVRILDVDTSVAAEDDFIEEAQTLAGLKHENVIRLIGVVCMSRPFYVVTESFERGSLRDCLRKGVVPTDDIDTLFDICIQTVSAMSYLEGLRYVLHRAVSSKNFLVADDMLVKLAAFDRARHVSDDGYRAPPSEAVPVRWAAPEVLASSTYSTRSDVWSLGVVFWEVFSTGERPYRSMSAEQAAVYVFDGGRLDRPPSSAPDIYAMMKSCWRASPSDRPSFAMLHDKIKGKSSIYYVSPIRGGGRHLTPTPNRLLLPVSAKSKISATAATFSKSPSTTPNGTAKAMFPSSEFQRYCGPKDRPDSGGRDRKPADMPNNSSSDSSSFIGMPVAIEPDHEPTAMDTIRKSMRKILKKKSSK